MVKLGTIAARRLREAREAEGLTQAELGEYLGLSRDAISKIEKGHAALGLRHLTALPKILNRPIAYFLDIDTGLTTEEEQLLTMYRHLPADSRRLALATLRAWLEADDPAPGPPPDLLSRLEAELESLTTDERRVVLAWVQKQADAADPPALSTKAIKTFRPE